MRVSYSSILHDCYHDCHVISIGVRVTSPSSVAEDLSDGASVKKAGRRGTKSATAPRASINRRGKCLYCTCIGQCSFVRMDMLV